MSEQDPFFRARVEQRAADIEVELAAQALVRERQQERRRLGTPLEKVFKQDEVDLCQRFLAQRTGRGSQSAKYEIGIAEVYDPKWGLLTGYFYTGKTFLCGDGRLRHLPAGQDLVSPEYGPLPENATLKIGKYERVQTREGYTQVFEREIQADSLAEAFKAGGTYTVRRNVYVPPEYEDRFVGMSLEERLGEYGWNPD